MKDFSRRGFLTGMAALVGGIALEKAIPLGRVWSFPSQIVIPQFSQYSDYVTLHDLTMATTMDPLLENMQRELAARLGLTLRDILRGEVPGRPV